MTPELLQELKTKHGVTFTGVVAMTPNRVIGKDGGMPWRLPEDLKTFQRLTTGHPIVMGRKTFDSIGRPLPGRQNIVLTRQHEWTAERVERIASLEELFALELMDSEVCIIGGAEIFSLCLSVLDVLWVSRISQEYPGDTWFPEFEQYFSGKELAETSADFALWKYVK